MRAFVRHRGVAAPLLQDDIDTDAIIPSREIRKVSRTGLGEGLFANWRYLSHEGRRPDPGFILNRDEWQNTEILLSGDNFGCGSSREHAVWALQEYGIRAIIASSFGRIFRDNCLANGLLPVTLERHSILRLCASVEQEPQKKQLEVDLEHCTVNTADGESYAFAIEEVHRQMLLQGLDALKMTLQMEEQIAAFRNRDRQRRPWAYRVLQDRPPES